MFKHTYICALYQQTLNSASDFLCLFDWESLYGTAILLSVHNLGDNNVSYLSCTAGGNCCWSMNVQELNTALCVCKIKFNSILLITLCCLRGHEMTMRLNWRDTVGIHLPGEHNNCVTAVQKLLHCAINNTVGDNERASKVWDWLLWSQAITRCLSPKGLQSAVGLNCRHSSVNSYSIGKPSEQRGSLPSSCCYMLIAFILEVEIKQKWNKERM